MLVEATASEYYCIRVPVEIHWLADGEYWVGMELQRYGAGAANGKPRFPV